MFALTQESRKDCDDKQRESKGSFLFDGGASLSCRRKRGILTEGRIDILGDVRAGSTLNMRSALLEEGESLDATADGLRRKSFMVVEWSGGGRSHREVSQDYRQHHRNRRLLNVQKIDLC